MFIDSPLLKSEITVRERSRIYHEESLKLSIKKNGSINVFHLMTEIPVNEKQLSMVCYFPVMRSYLQYAMCFHIIKIVIFVFCL